MFSNFGETWEAGDRTKCPGETSCDDWKQPWEPPPVQSAECGVRSEEELHSAKEASICHGCPMFESKGNAVNAETTDEIESFVDDLEDIAEWEDAGFTTDWSAYDFDTRQLFKLWRTTEAECKEMRERRLDALVKGFLK